MVPPDSGCPSVLSTPVPSNHPPQVPSATEVVVGTGGGVTRHPVGSPSLPGTVVPLVEGRGRLGRREDRSVKARTRDRPPRTGWPGTATRTGGTGPVGPVGSRCDGTGRLTSVVGPT